MPCPAQMTSTSERLAEYNKRSLQSRRDILVSVARWSERVRASPQRLTPPIPRPPACFSLRSVPTARTPRSRCERALLVAWFDSRHRPHTSLCCPCAATSQMADLARAAGARAADYEAKAAEVRLPQGRACAGFCCGIACALASPVLGSHRMSPGRASSTADPR